MLDFGLVKAEQKEEVGLTAEGTVQGTPAYLAPEMVSGSAPISSQSDLYALGCVAYFLLTGRLVFERDTVMKTAIAHATEAPLPPSELSEEDIPAAFEQIVMSLLAKAPDDRPNGAAELAERLEACGLDPWSEDEARRWWTSHMPEAGRGRLQVMKEPQPLDQSQPAVRGG